MKKLGIAFLLLTCFASPVSAGCAWVLWVMTSSNIIGSMPVDSFETKELCQKEISWLEMKQSGGRKLNPPATALEMSWRCFPDTIDPRGVKEK